jgi:ribosome biogenesis GTPase A
MAITEKDLDRIAEKLEPKFIALKADVITHVTGYVDKRVKESEQRVIADMSKVYNDGLGMISEKFEAIERRFKGLRIESKP